MSDAPKVTDAQLADALNALTPVGALRTIIVELAEIRQSLNESIANCSAVPRLKALEDLAKTAFEGEWELDPLSVHRADMEVAGVGEGLDEEYYLNVSSSANSLFPFLKCNRLALAFGQPVDPHAFDFQHPPAQPGVFPGADSVTPAEKMKVNIDLSLDGDYSRQVPTSLAFSSLDKSRPRVGGEPEGIIAQNLAAMATEEAHPLWVSHNHPGLVQREEVISLQELEGIAATRKTDPRVDDVVAATVGKFINPQDAE